MMHYRCDDVPVWQAWCRYQRELSALHKVAQAFAEPLDADPVYGASVYGQILVGVAPRHFDDRADRALWSESGYAGVRVPRRYVPKGQLKAGTQLRERFPGGRPAVDIDRARLAPLWEALGVDIQAVAKAGAIFFGYDGQFYFTTLMRAPNATVIGEHEFTQALQLSQSTSPSR
ncbi:hypothetical protein ACW5WQ_21200 [Aeromonas rivuli]|uniref:hypothetical protein n=1 Tax=Aeromonas rivuli TaxID=648794 RepID=UPI0005A99DA9|nr:hypothetical protein [Aeromonas rivuli]